MQRWNFTRYADGAEMAEGTSVHAVDLLEATLKANAMKEDGDELVFRDSLPCITACEYCDVEGANKP
jgi:hypothetical protein